MIAVKNGQSTIVRTLIKEGADAQARNNRGLSAIDLAEQRGQQEIIAILKSAK
jgi:ankyrin repeat protein